MPRRCLNQVEPALRRLTLNTESKNRSRQLLLLAGFVAIVGGIAFLVPLPYHSRLSSRFGDLVHLPAYVLITYLAIVISDRFVSDKLFIRALTVMAIISVSGCIELLQSKFGRTASFADLFTNASGAFAALLVRLSSGCDSIAKRFTRVSAIILFVYVASGPVRSLIDVLRIHQYPASLGEFKSSTELERWYISSATAKVVDDDEFGFDGKPGTAAEVVLQPGDFPAIQLQHLAEDWSGYETIEFDLSRSSGDSPEPLAIQLRISDRFSRKNPNIGFSEVYQLAPGERKRVSRSLSWIAKASGRRVDLTRIRFVEFMAVELKQSATIRIGNLRLHRRRH